jgi:prepilin-type processing-associated H-X9-DG protein
VENVNDHRAMSQHEPFSGYFTAAAPPNSGIARTSTCDAAAFDSFLPCTVTSDDGTQRQFSARSKHTSGVNASFCDGSVQPVEGKTTAIDFALTSSEK